MNAIRHIRTEIFKAKQMEFADIANVGQATVSRWESGTSSPTLDELKSIRDEALRRGLQWNDQWFFALPTAAQVSA